MSATATDPNLKHLHLAREQIAKGDLKNAAQTLNKAQKQAPNDPRVFVLAGVMAEKSGNIPGAFDALQRAVTLAPRIDGAHSAICISTRSGNWMQSTLLSCISALMPSMPSTR